MKKALVSTPCKAMIQRHNTRKRGYKIIIFPLDGVVNGGVWLERMNYKNWLESVYTALDQWPVNMVAGWENRFAVIDFRGMYRAGFTPQYAADLAKNIATFLKPTINRGKS